MVVTVGVHSILLSPREVENRQNPLRMEHWQRIAEGLLNVGFSWGCSSKSDSTGRVLFTADAYAPDGRRFTILADERLTAFVALHAAIRRHVAFR